ncbi:hypothetical protein B5X24_HaOG213161 [Helicoverpa armigera]|uniref:Uncharacterized protein n=1 Tax=Helicoverpa armigera TaxID=29058 RepID=A0A2W1BE26_HELAM|nr:hypothetical protein B5X24_HaOG213161 [Helicoverpa armigera]
MYSKVLSRIAYVCDSLVKLTAEVKVMKLCLLFISIMSVILVAADFRYPNFGDWECDYVDIFEDNYIGSLKFNRTGDGNAIDDDDDAIDEDDDEDDDGTIPDDELIVSIPKDDEGDDSSPGNVAKADKCFGGVRGPSGACVKQQ